MTEPQIPAKRKPLRPLPLPALAISFALGITIAAYSDLYPELWLAGMVIVFLPVILTRRCNIFLFLLLFTVLGGARYSIPILFSDPNNLGRLIDTKVIRSGEPAIIEGRVKSRPEPGDDGYRLRLRVGSIESKGEKFDASGEIMVYVAPSNSQSQTFTLFDLPVGSGVRVACRPIREEAMQNPGVRSRLAMLSSSGLDAVCSVKSPSLVEITALPDWPSPIDAAARLRTYLILEFRRLLDVRTSGVVSAAIAGDRHFLDKQTSDLFREGGTFHILVISGLHITFLGGILIWLLGLVSKNRLLHLFGVGAVIWLFALTVGGEVPVIRAAIMLTVFLLARTFYRPGTGANAFALTLVVLLIWRPADLFEASFQLTTVSVAAILLIAIPLLTKFRKIGEWHLSAGSPFPPNVSLPLKRLAETIYWNNTIWEIGQSGQIWKALLRKQPFTTFFTNRLPRKITARIIEAVFVSVVVQFTMLPLSIWYFHRWMPMGFLLNLWVGPLLAVECFAAIATVFSALFSETLASGFAFLAGFLNQMMLVLPKMVSDFGITGERVPIYPGFLKLLYFLYFIPIIAIVIAAHRWNPFILGRRQNHLFWAGTCSAVIGVMIAVILILHPGSSPQPDGKLYVEFLDVGQGDAAFITLPDGKTMLIDGGGRPDFRTGPEGNDSIKPSRTTIGESVVSEFLWEKGISRIDYLVASHSDADHMEGLLDVANNFTIGEFWVNREVIENQIFTELDEIARQRTFVIRKLRRGDFFDISGCRIEILWPPEIVSDALSDNDASLVFSLTYGRRRFLFTGDAEQTAETGLIQSDSDLHADVVKVPHHGSRTSSSIDFVRAVSAEYAVISVGQRSIFRHPHSEVVARWENAGAPVLITGKRGTISFISDGETLWFTTFRSDSDGGKKIEQ